MKFTSQNINFTEVYLHGFGDNNYQPDKKNPHPPSQRYIYFMQLVESMYKNVTVYYTLTRKWEALCYLSDSNQQW